MKHRILRLLILLLLPVAAFCKPYQVKSQQELESILPGLQPGDEVVIANGTYAPWALVIAANGTAAKPITIRAQSPGKVIFTGDVSQPVFRLTGSYIILEGLTFTGCNLLKEKRSGILIELANSSNCRVAKCTFSQNAAKAQFLPLVVISGKGQYNQVDQCTFTANTDNQELQVKVTKDAAPQFTLISNNVFSDKKKVSWKNGNGGECVQVGQDPIMLGTVPANTTVRQNRFIRCNGEPEVISNKSSNNAYINNYFEDCQGELVMRGGHDCIIDSNTIKGGSGGIRVNGTGHWITHNNIKDVKTGIRLMYGMAKGKTEIGFYVAASGCTIANNRIENAVTGILIGDSKNVDWTGKFDTTRYPSRVMQDVAPAENVVNDNTFINTKNEIVHQE